MENLKRYAIPFVIALTVLIVMAHCCTCEPDATITVLDEQSYKGACQVVEINGEEYVVTTNGEVRKIK